MYSTASWFTIHYPQNTTADNGGNFFWKDMNRVFQLQHRIRAPLASLLFDPYRLYTTMELQQNQSLRSIMGNFSFRSPLHSIVVHDFSSKIFCPSHDHICDQDNDKQIQDGPGL